MSDERTLNERLARLLGGEAHVQHYDGAAEVDVEASGWVIECSFARGDALAMARWRVEYELATYGNVLAVVYPRDTTELDDDSTIAWLPFRADGGALVQLKTGQTVAGLRRYIQHAGRVIVPPDLDLGFGDLAERVEKFEYAAALWVASRSPEEQESLRLSREIKDWARGAMKVGVPGSA